MLHNSLEYGIKERDFWDMTPGEIVRECNAISKARKLALQEQATLDYIHAQLITKGISIVLGDKSAFPQIHDVYPNIFDDVIEEQKAKIAEQKAMLSASRFRQFAQSYNSRHKQVGGANK